MTATTAALSHLALTLPPFHALPHTTAAIIMGISSLAAIWRGCVLLFHASWNHLWPCQAPHPHAPDASEVCAIVVNDESRDIVSAVREIETVIATIQDVRENVQTHHSKWFPSKICAQLLVLCHLCQGDKPIAATCQLRHLVSTIVVLYPSHS